MIRLIFIELKFKNILCTSECSINIELFEFLICVLSLKFRTFHFLEATRVIIFHPVQHNFQCMLHEALGSNLYILYLRGPSATNKSQERQTLPCPKWQAMTLDCNDF